MKKVYINTNRLIILLKQHMFGKFHSFTMSLNLGNSNDHLKKYFIEKITIICNGTSMKRENKIIVKKCQSNTYNSQ